MPEQLMPGRGSYGGGKTWDIPPKSYFPPPRIFTTKFQHYSRMVYARANYFRMAISTSRMPQKQCQSIYFSKIFWGGMPPDLPSGGVLKHALRIDANFGIPPPPYLKSCMNPCLGNGLLCTVASTDFCHSCLHLAGQ